MSSLKREYNLYPTVYFFFIPQNVKLKDLGSQDVQCHTLEINDHRENKLRVLAYTFFII